MMSGMVGADVMSIDSGPESEFRFQDMDAKKDEIEIDIENTDVQVKKRSASTSKPIKKLIGVGGIPIAPALQKKKTFSGQSDLGGIDADDIISKTL